MLCTLNHGPAPSLSRFSEECSHGGIISGHWLGVGSVMRHFLSRSWPELHRRIICPAGFLPYTIHGTSIRTIPYYTMPVYYLHGTGAHGTVSQARTTTQTFLPPLRPEEKCNQFLQPQPTTITDSDNTQLQLKVNSGRSIRNREIFR